MKWVAYVIVIFALWGVFFILDRLLDSLLAWTIFIPLVLLAELYLVPRLGRLR